MAVINVGDVIRLARNFITNVGPNAGGYVDPDVVSVVVSRPDNTTASPLVVKDAVGQYHADYTVTVSGLHVYRWTGTGVNASVEEAIFAAALLGF